MPPCQYFNTRLPVLCSCVVLRKSRQLHARTQTEHHSGYDLRAYEYNGQNNGSCPSFGLTKVLHILFPYRAMPFLYYGTGISLLNNWQDLVTLQLQGGAQNDVRRLY